MPPRRNYSRNKGGNQSGMDVDNGQASTAASNNVEIRNWQGGSDRDLINFIQRKVNVHVKNNRVIGQVFSARVNPNETDAIKRMDGMRFAGGVLTVNIIANGATSNGSPAPATGDTIQVLNHFLMSRYNAGAKLLNLSNMKSDPILIQHGLFATPTTESKMFPALMKLASTSIPAVESVSLESNDISTVTAVSSLAQTYPNLLNLSLAHNAITNLHGITPFRNKFPVLRELVLAGNPVANQQHAIVEMFPRLAILDGVVVRDLPPPAAPNTKMPLPITPRFFENDAIAKVAQDFLANFFRFWDEDRNQLIQLYDDMSEFSLSFDADAPHIGGATVGGAAYTRITRNFMTVKGPGSTTTRQKRLALGPQAVSSTFSQIPPSKHDINDPNSFAIDSWQVSGVRAPGDTGIIISIHGDFNEISGNRKILRSFDRTLIILQTPQGAMIVASDLLTIRPQGDNAAFRPTPDGPAPGAPGAPGVPAGPQPGIAQPMGTQPGVVPPMATQQNPEQVVQALMQQTNLNMEYATMCAQQANFDLNQAMALFEQSRGQLPPNAYN